MSENKMDLAADFYLDDEELKRTHDAVRKIHEILQDYDLI
jgi:hypothetical protein